MDSDIFSVTAAVRIFQEFDGVRLSRGRVDPQPAIRPGSTINVKAPVIRYYDHRFKVAIPFESTTTDGLILFEELSSRDQEGLRDMFPGNPILQAQDRITLERMMK